MKLSTLWDHEVRELRIGKFRVTLWFTCEVTLLAISYRRAALELQWAAPGWARSDFDD